jgi:hypothetical protein
MDINKCDLYENEFKHFTFLDTSTLLKRSNKMWKNQIIFTLGVQVYI